MIKRLRERAQQPEIRYDHTRWTDHIIRVEFTAGIVRGLRLCHPEWEPSVADLSCGDGAIVARSGPWAHEWRGDILPGWDLTGDIMDTIWLISDVDVFVCTETLEHVDRPGDLLHRIRAQARCLVLSTPDDETDDRNPEHLWGWDMAGVKMLLDQAGWKHPMVTPLMIEVGGTAWRYQIWVAYA